MHQRLRARCRANAGTLIARTGRCHSGDDHDPPSVRPRATLTLYEKQFLSARWVGFTPDSREPSLIEALGFGGRIESMKLSC